MRKSHPHRRSATRAAARPSALLLRLVARISGWLKAWLARWNPLRRARKAVADYSRIHFETLEPRLLMSADLMPLAQTTLVPHATVAVERSSVADTSASSTGRMHALAVAPGATGSATVTDADGTVITVTITGNGALELLSQGAGYALNIAGTNAASVVTLTASGGDGKALLTGISADTALGEANLAAADLTGSASFTAVATLKLGNISNASITNGSVGEASISAKTVADLRLNAPLARLSVSADSWTNSMPGLSPSASFLNAAGLRSLTVAGEFSADVRLSGTGLTGFVLGNASIGGALSSGQWFVIGRANSLQAGSTGGAWRAHFTDNLGQLKTTGDLSGFVAAGGLQVLSVGGSLRGATLLLGANLGTDAQLGGSGDAADRFSAGTLARLRVVGDIVDTRIAISLDPVNGVLFDGNDVSVGTAANRMQELIVGGQLRGSTLIVAPALPALVNVGGAVVDPATLPQLSTTPRDAVLPQLSAQLRSDTGSSASDGITSDASLLARVVDVGGVAALRGRINNGSGAFQSLAYTIQADGSLLVSAASLTALNGGSLPDGAYSIELQAADFAGNASNTATVAFTLDRTAPSATVALAAASDTGTIGDNITTASSVTIEGTTAAGTLVALANPAQSTTAAADGTFSFSGLALALGDNDFAFTLTDAAGNTGTTSLRIRRDPPVVVDTTPPTVTAALAADTGSSASDGITRNPAIAGQASDNVGVVQLLATLDPGASGTPTFTDLTSLLAAGGSFTLNRATLDSLAGGTLADGAHTVRLIARDAAGNESTPRDVSFTLDTAAPSATLVLAAGSDTGTPGDNITTASTVTIGGSTEAGALVSLASPAQTTTAAADGSYSFSGLALALGANDFSVTVTDAAGNTGTATLRVTRETAGGVDTTAPTVTAALQADTGSSATDGLTNNPAISGLASDNVGVVQLLAAIDPGNGSTQVFTDLSSLLAANGSFTISKAVLDAMAGGTLADGVHTVRLLARDAAGNQSTPRDVVFTLDTGAPAFTGFGLATADASNDTLDATNSATVQLKGTAEAGARVTLGGLSTVAGAGGAFVLPGVALNLGANALTLTATDTAGNSSTFTRTITRSAQVQGDQVLAWSDIALKTIQRDVTDVPVATRVLAIQGIAVYDTLAAIEGTPAYLVQRTASGAVSASAAVAQAAYRVLYQLYPGQRAILDAALATSLASIADSAAKTAGIALGDEIARAVLTIRASDGYLNFTTDDGGQAVGQWRPTAPMFLTADNPQWAQVTPFALDSGSEFRAAPPPALDSAEYAAAINEVKALGSASGSTRTPDQTQQALFWADGGGSYTPPGHWVQIAAQVAAANGQSLSANARMMAQLNVALADAAIACWDTKYTYDFWRPVTAIQNADTDGNPATAQDASWTPLLITPPHPTYVSGHSSFSAAAAGILAATFGDATAFSTTSATLPGVTRSFSSFSQAAAEAGQSRIYGGIHTRLDNLAGRQLGTEVASAVLARFALQADTQAPTVVAATTPAAASTNVTITGQILDNLSGVASATVQVDGAAAQALALDAQGHFSFATTLATDGSADGNHTLTIMARDAAGNVSAGYTRSFVLDTRAPTLDLTSLADGASLTATARLTGAASGTGSGITLLNYQLDGGAARSLVFDAGTGAFNRALDFGNLQVGDHTLTLNARDAAGNTTTLTRQVKVDALAPFTVTGLTPVNASRDIGVTQRPQVTFSRAVNVATLTADSFYASAPDGSKIAATIIPAADGSFASLFFTNPMPGGAQVTVHVDGAKIRAASDGAFLDADGNGSPGGEATATFTTVSTTSVVGTRLVGKVVDPGPDLLPMTFDDIRRGPDGVIHTPDDVFLLPIAHAKVYIIGQEGRFVYTDAAGNFELTDVPAGSVKVAVDGRTATNAPAGVFFPEMVMDVDLVGGATNTMMGSMGAPQQRIANADRREVYLPRVATSVLQAVSDTQPTVITAADPKAAPALTDAQRGELTLTVNPGSAVDESGNAVANVKIGIATVPPELVKDMLPPGVLEHTFDITIQAPGVATFTQPVQITFPNVFNAAPGTKLDILSFDHTTGMLVINGTGTVSADGLTVVSDEDSGVRAPGWHGMAPPGPNGRNDTPRPPRRSPPTPPNPPTPPTPPTPPVPPVIIIIVGLPPPVVIVVPPVVVTPPPVIVLPPPVIVVPGLPNAPGFQIDVRMPASGLSAAQQTAVNAAVARWQQLVVGDLPADWTVDGLVDDLRIRLNIANIDGAGGTLATTQIRDVRSGAIKLPSLADITIDQADLAGLSAAQFQALLMHEIAHAMGFGDLWASLGLVDTTNAANPRFTGTNAAAAFATLTGTAQTSVPIDNRSGANATHWREAIFGNELMTPLLDPSGPYPVSALTIASLTDMGYTTQPAAADAYALPGPGFVFHPNATAPANTGNGELLDATGGGVTTGQVAAAAPPTTSDHLFFAFDFGAPASPVATGYAGVSASTAYSAARGWGWQAGSAVTDQRTGTNPLAPQTSDFALTSNGTFKVDLPNGTYDVIVTVGDDAAAHEDMVYSIEGVRRGAATTLAGQHASLTHRVEVVDGQMTLDFGGNGIAVALNALEIHQVSTYTTPASTVDYTSGTYYLAIQNLDTGFILRDRVEVSPGAALCINGVVLSPNTAYRQYIYHVESNSVGVSEFVSPGSGVNFSLPEVPLGNRISADTDGDGLEDAAEFIVNTNANKADTDGDGLGDRVELVQNLDPRGGAAVSSGVIASQALQGDAVALDVVVDPTNAAKLTAFVATGSRGLAVVDVSRFTTPILLADLDLPGTAQDVAVDAARQRALVAAGSAGLLLIDISSPAAPTLLATLPFAGDVSHVEVRDGLAFVSHGGSISVVDINTGDVRQTVVTGAGSIQALAVDGDALFAITDSTTLRAFNAAGGTLLAAGNLVLPTAGRSLFVADGVATIGAESNFLAGFMTARVSDLANLSLLSDVDVNSIAGRAVVLNGSGLGVAVGTPGGAFGGRVIDVVNTRDPANTGATQARYTIPSGTPNDVRIAGGMAYVAAGSAGLVVVNYAGFDNLGVAPTVSISADAVDVDVATDGIQVIEGRRVRVVPTVTDDVQIRSLELLVNGTVVAGDASYPYELFASAPTIASGGTSMTLQVRATDTGGNVTLSNIVSVGVVPDNFAPQVASINLIEASRRFLVRTVDIVFDEPLDVALLSTSGVRIVRAGPDGSYGTPDDIAAPLHLDTRAGGQQLSIVLDAVLASGDYRLTVDPAVISDRAGNKLATPIVRNFTIRPASDVRATSGIPDISTAPSANPGQQIGIAVPFDPATARMQFNVVDAAGNVTTRVLTPVRVDTVQNRAFFTVPVDAVSGDVVVYSLVGAVRTDFTDGTFPLQILPTISDIQIESVAGDGSSAQVLIAGTGFVEAAGSEYRFGSQSIIDGSAAGGPDVFGRSDPVLGFIANGYVRVTVPVNDGVFGAINLKTAGGVSASYTASIASITATALSGTPANAAQASANAGQAVTLNGSNLSTTSDILLRYVDINGAQQMVRLSPSAASADGTSATLIVPDYANGAFSLQLFGSSTQPLLQIVPTLTSLDVQDRTVLFGSGFVEGASNYSFPGASVADTPADAASSVDVYYGPGNAVQNGGAYINRTALPTHGLGGVTVTTAGGTSASLANNSVRTNVAGTSLGDVAVDATGKLWVSDYTQPGHLLKIDPATGGVLQTITLTADFGTPYTYNHSGLQVLTAPMTLGATSVPAGSLLVFNGYPNTDRVLAVNPATGAVLASLTLGANYDLTGATYDAASNRIFLTGNIGAGNSIISVSATTGAELASFTAPFFVTNWSGLAIDPTSGHLWLGAINGGSQLVEYLIGAGGSLTELRRVDATSQGINQNEISGLSFDAAGALWVASTQGEVYKIDTTRDGAAVPSATLTGLTSLALQGTAANAGVASANVGQVIELTGTNFGAGTRVLFTIRDNAGATRVVSQEPLVINAGGTRLQVQVPDAATTADVRVVNQGSRNLGFGASYADAVYRNVSVNFTAGSANATIRFADGGLEGLANESWGIDNVNVKRGDATVFADNFESGTANAAWSDATVNADDIATFSRFSGRFSDSASQVLNLAGLTAGQTYTLNFDLLVLDTWDGNNSSNGPDLIDVSVDGKSLLRETLSNVTEVNSAQTLRASAGIRLQVVPTLSGIINGRPGEDDSFNLIGSGFMEGASTVTIGGVAFIDSATNLTPFDVTGAQNGNMTVVAPRTLDGPIRISTEGGFAQLPLSLPVQAASVFTGITASASVGVPGNAGQPAANTGQTITLTGQGFTSNTLVQFQGRDDSGTNGTLTRTGTVGAGGTTLTVTVPAIARSGAVTVLGSATSFDLQIVPTLKSAGGTVAAGNTIVLEGSGFSAGDLAITIDGRGVGSFTVRTIVDGTSGTPDQQLITLTVPAGVSAGRISVSSGGGSAVLRSTLAITALADQTPAVDIGDTLATALNTNLAGDQRVNISADIGTALDVDLYRVDMTAGDQLTLNVSNAAGYNFVRIFDATGTQVQAPVQFNPGSANNLLRWTAPAGGSYYIGLSGYANTSYNPNVTGSGNNAGYLGAYTLSLERLAAGSDHLVTSTTSATSGTAAQAGLASVNIGQTVTFSGTGLLASDRLVFTTLDDSGNLSEVVVAATTVDLGAQTISAVVPVSATTGRVRLERDATGVLLQVVPVLSDVTMNAGGGFEGANLQLSGSGFAEGAVTVQLGGQNIADIDRFYGNDVFSQGTRINVAVPASAATGPVRVTTVGGTSTAFGITLTSISTGTTSGTPTNAANAAGNAGQAITLNGSGLDATTDVVFKVTDAAGNIGDLIVRATAVNAAGTQLQVLVPINATSGVVRVVGSADAIALQILPTITDVQVESVAADGSTAQVLIAGTGLVEGNSSEYRFGSRVVLDAGTTTGADVFGRNDATLGFIANGYVRLTVPLSDGVFGAINLKTAGGVSASYTASIASITATALSGTPANAAQASANAGQAVTLNGSNLSTASDILLRYVDINGTLQMVRLSPSAASADGTSATLIVPDYANGAFSLQLFGSSTQPLLQIVPTLTSLDVQDRTVLFGSGFVEGASNYSFPGASVADTGADAGTTVDVYYGPGNAVQNGGAYLNRTALPSHGLGGVTVTTAGGTSASLANNSVRTNVAGTSLGDVAVDATGKLWVSDYTQPGHLLKIDPATGGVLQTITLTNDFGTPYTYNYAGLQVLGAAMTLGATSVPAGSLLVFNGYPNPDRVLAVNPTTGAVIASLTLDANYDLTGATFDAAHNLIYLTENNGTGNRIVAVSATTGVLASVTTAPFNIQSWSGLAIDPTSGHLWLGAINGGSQLVEYLIGAGGSLTELRRVDATSQGINQNEISGLSFDAAGALWVASTQGEVYKIDTTRDGAAVPSATLTGLTSLALQGTAANAGVASANVGQVIELTGTNFGAGTRVLFTIRDNAGATRVVSQEPLVINAGGTRLQVQVPDAATTADVRVVNQGSRNLGFGASYADAVYRNVSVNFTAGSANATIRFADGGLEGLANESWGIDNVNVKRGDATVFADNFESGTANAAWSDATVNADDIATFSRFSGRFSDSASQVLNLAGLTAGQTYTLNFDLLVLDTWDGNNSSNGPDLIDVSVDGKSLLRETLSNVTEVNSAQTLRASAGIRLQVVPTLSGIINGRPGEDDSFNLIGSGFMEGASTVTIGGVAFIDSATNLTPFDVTGAQNGNMTVVAPRTLDGPIRISTEGGFAQLPLSLPVQAASVFTGITASASVGVPGNAGQPAANTGQTITLTGQGFTSNTLVQFQGRDDSGTNGTLTRTGTVGAGGTTLTVTVPAIARSGAVTVLGSATSFDLQIVPTLKSAGGTVAAGNTIVLEGSGFSAGDLAITIDGRGVGSFTVRTIVDGTSGTPDQQLITLTVPAGVSAGRISVSSGGGSAVLRSTLAITALADQTPAVDIGDTLATALNTNLAGDQRVNISADIGTALDVDLYRVDMTAGDQLTLNVSNAAGYNFVRIFDATGTQVQAPVQFNPGSANNLLRWTAPAGGSYYIGLSGYANTSYNPNVTGSGNNAGYLGAYTLSLERLAAGSDHLVTSTTSATSGTAAQAGLASVNIGQTVTFSGTGLLASDRLVFTTLDDSGNLSEVVVAATTVDLGAQTISAVVPVSATTGRVRLERDATGVLLQVVPVLSDVTMNAGGGFEGANLQLSGSGFAEGAVTVQLGGQNIADIDRFYGNDVFSQGTRINVAVPASAATGPVRVTTVGGTSTAFGITLTSISTGTTSGTPTNAANAAGNAGQAITLNGSGLDATTDVVFKVTDAAGNIGDLIVRATAVNAAGTQLQVLVPINATSGVVRVVGSADAIALQILPTITDVQVESVAADGSTAQVLIAGTGLVEGNSSEYRFGSRVVLDAGTTTGADVFGRNDATLGFIANGYVRLTVPLSDGVFGAINLKTAGGVSASYTASIASITATALSGTPANAAQASANAGQAVTLNGSNLSTASDILLRYVDINGTLQMVRLSPSAASADGTSATLIVPDYANGAFSLQLFGSSTQPLLQIVPTLTSLDVQDRTVLFGSGFVEGASNYSFPGASVADTGADAGTTVDVYYGPGNAVQNGGAYLNRTALPSHGLGGVTVTTAGGTSASLANNSVRTNVAGTSLGDVAVDATGKLWVSDYTQPGHLLKIDPATGGVLQTITLTNDFGTPYTYNYAGLQVLGAAMTLGATSVPAGSLLVFNGYPNPDRVLAVNPTTGAVIASLTLDANYDLTGATFDAAHNLIYLTENNGTGNRIVAVSATTGVLASVTTAPFNIQSWSGLAIDPTSGHLWLGAVNGGSQLVEYLIGAGGSLTELRRVDATSQGINQNEISGLSFDASGALWVASTQGEIYKIALP